MKSMLKLNSETKSIRYGGIDLLKHLFALFVIFQHMTSESRYSDDLNFFIKEMVSYIDGAVMGFILISGFFFHPSKTIKSSIYKIFKRMMIPFFLFSILYTILMWVLGKGSLSNGLWQTITLHGAGMQLYYLSYLFVISSVYIMMSFLAEKMNISFRYIILAILVVCTIISLILPTASSTGSDYRLIPVYFLCFGVGISFSMLRKKNLNRFYISIVSAIILGFIIGFYDHRFYDLSFVSFLFLCAYKISINIEAMRRPFQGSGGVYLLHTPIVNFAISSVLIMMGISEYFNLFFAWILTYIFCLIISLLFIRYLPSYKWILLE